MSITINVTPLATGSVAASASQDSVNLTVQSGIGPVGPQGALVGGTGIDASFANGNLTVSLNATLSDLTDVSAAVPSTGQVLEWNGTQWAPGTDNTLSLASATPSNLGTAAAGTGTAAARDDHVHAMPGLGDLTDVTLSSPASGEVLTWNGSAWTAAADSTNLTGYATESFVTSAVANLVDSSPAALDTLNELAAALGDDANFAANVTASLSGKAAANHNHTSADVTDFATAASANAPIQTVNNATGDITIANGTGLTLTANGSTLTLAAALPPSNLADLADVSGTPSTNQALIYNGSEWQPGDIPAGTTINSLSGSVVVANGTGITLTESGQTLTLAAVAQGGDVDGGTFGAAGNVLTEGGDNLAAETGDTLTVEGGSSTAGDSIQLLRSSVAGVTPSTLLAGELAINTEDGLLYWQRANGTIASADIDLTLATVATSGSYNDLADLPTLGTAAATAASDYATAAQGTLADSAVQPGDLATVATTGSYNDLSGIPTEFTPSAHTHTAGDVTDFGTAAAANAPLQSLNSLTGTLTIAGSGGTTVTEAGSTITVASTAPPTVLADLSDVSTATPSTGQVLKWTGSAWAPQTDATNGTGGGGGGGGYGSLLLFG